MVNQEILLNAERNVTLTGWLLGVEGEFQYIKKRPAVLILPGGGYQFCSDREADPVALAYLQAGYHAFVLRYSVKQYAAWPNPLEDYEQAMAYIRTHAQRLGICEDKIAVVGFSAGGHLAACAASMAKNRPDAAVLGYAVVGEDVKGCSPTAPDVLPAVDANTCPCFVFATRTDNVVPVDNSLRFLQALDDHGVAFESHIYAYGPHGFSVCNSGVNLLGKGCSRMPRWVDDSVAWLKDMFGEFCPEGFTAPACKPLFHTDEAPYLGVDCTYRHLRTQPDAKPVIDALRPSLPSDNARALLDMGEAFDSHLRKMTFRDVLTFSGVSPQTIEEIHARLSRIPNHPRG